MVVGTSKFYRVILIFQIFSVTDFQMKKHAQEFPTLARLAIDILPIQASSVPCERLFSSAKEITTDKRSRLGPVRFEQLQMLKHHWRSGIIDLALWNLGHEEEMVYVIEDFEDMLQVDEEFKAEEMEKGSVTA